jgi:hypothetical protein
MAYGSAAAPVTERGSSSGVTTHTKSRPRSPGGSPVGINEIRGSLDVICPGVYSRQTRSDVFGSHRPKST